MILYHFFGRDRGYDIISNVWVRNMKHFIANNSPNASLSYATLCVFMEKIQKIFREIFFQFFFGYRGSTANLGYACKNLGGLGPLV
jgi:hypothetical protein